MAWLVSLCVRRYTAVTIIVAILSIIAVSKVIETPLDVFPEFVPTQVSIQTEAPGLTPEQVESVVTRPLEAAVGGAPGLASVRSESVPGLSVLSLDFAEGTEPNRAHQDIAERLSRVSSTLPDGVGAPKLSPLTSSTMDLLKVGLVAEDMSPFQLRDLADWIIKPQLLAVPGVARVNVYGGAVRQIHILPDLAKLDAYGLDLSDLANAASSALAMRGGGFIDTPAQRVLIESPIAAPDPAVLAEAVVAVRSGVSLRLGDLATVEFGAALRAGDAVVQGKPGVLLTISSQYGANTMTATSAVEAALGELTPRLTAQGVTVYPAIHRPANFIERSLRNLRDALVVAALLILVVLFAFLRDLRSVVISFVTIPVSLLAAILVLQYLGQTLNTLTLGGLAVAIGVLVDDAIIDIENIMRRLRLHAGSADSAQRLEVVRAASLEIRSPVLFATLAVLIVFIPVYTISGVQGRFVGPLALAFMLAVLASLIVALTLTPALCALLLKDRPIRPEARWIAALKRAQARFIGFASAHVYSISAVLLLAFGGCLLWLPYLGGEFMPEFREGHFVVQTSSAVPGTSFDEMMGLGERIGQALIALPYVSTAAQQIGRAELGEDTWGPNRSEFHVELVPDSPVDQLTAQAEIRALVESFPGLHTEVVTFLGDRFSESLTGETANVVINVFGDDLDALDRAGARIASALQTVPGLVDLQYERQSATPELLVYPDPSALRDYGLTRQTVLDTVQTAFAGLVVGQAFDGPRSIDVVVILPEASRQRPDTIGSLKVHSPFGPVPVAQLARIEPAVGRSAVLHSNGQRRVVVTFNVEGRSLQSVVDDARARIAAIADAMPGVYVRFAGESEAERVARLELIVYSGLALVAVVLVLFLGFRRRRFPWLVLANLPFSMIGSIVAIGLTGIGLTIGTLVGLVTVFGISARNTILLLAHYEHLADVDGMAWTPELLVRGADERLLPILMTALVTGLGVAPLALGMGQAGYEIEGPMAITVLGGLATSTLLNLFILPALIGRFGTALAR